MRSVVPYAERPCTSMTDLIWVVVGATEPTQSRSSTNG